MSEKCIVICDADLRYANALAENILEREELNVSIFTFASEEKCRRFLQKKKADIWIMDEHFWRKDEEYHQEVFILTKGEPPKEVPREHLIYKYQCADEIIHQILENYIEKTREDVLKKFHLNSVRVEAVYSPIRGIGKTRFTIALGKEYGKSEKVLYLNMETYAGFEEAVLDENKVHLGDLLYYLKQNEEQFGMQLQNAVEKMGSLAYVMPIYVSEDLRGVPKEDWVLFLEKIMSFGWYDRILLDVDEGIQGLFFVLQMCDKIYMPIREDGISKQKIERYEICIERLGFSALKEKTRKFVIEEPLEECVRVQMREER